MKQAEHLTTPRAVIQRDTEEMSHNVRAELDAVIRQHVLFLQAVEERHLLLRKRAQVIVKPYDVAGALDPLAMGL
ncbi:hypothetical protein JKF63_00171 [Porcisia hertigi]|uniref:Uncharacterized protein n=1 Tax=Porcisia hertigi TaxID=2761500 RepID=A0A836HPI2_9TRYP|nr:hypothetical protein JKF63_00171 [Porcisia hertigi]